MDNVNSRSLEGYTRSPCVVHPDVLDGVNDDGNGNVVRIARGIFSSELADLITVLRTCGALRTKVEYFWCVKELWRLLRAGE